MNSGSDPVIPPVPPGESSLSRPVIPFPSGGARPASPAALQALLKNPLIVAGGALVTGLVLSRVFASQSARRMAGEIAVEALRRVRSGGVAGTPPPGPPVPTAGGLVDEVVERFRPQVTDYAKKILADILRKKQ